MLRPMVVAAVMIAASILSPPLSGDAYKWVDEQGQVHYGDKPPAGTSTETVRPPPSANRDDAARQRDRLEQAEKWTEVRRAERSEKAAAKEAEKQETSRATERCLALRRELDVLDWGGPVYLDERGRFRVKAMHDAYQGERRYLDEHQKSVEIARVRGEIAAECGDPDDPGARGLARLQQVWAERCEAARADLEMVMRPEARTSHSTLESHRRRVAYYCDE